MDRAKTRLTPTMAIPESRLYTRLDISDDISVRNAFSVDDGDAHGGVLAAPEGGAPGTSPAAPRFDGLDTSPGGAGRQSTPCNRLPDSGYVSTNHDARVGATQFMCDEVADGGAPRRSRDGALAAPWRPHDGALAAPPGGAPRVSCGLVAEPWRRLGGPMAVP